jgi:hypothetical protein
MRLGWSPWVASPGVMEGGETPFAVLGRGDEGLEWVALRRGLGKTQTNAHSSAHPEPHCFTVKSMRSAITLLALQGFT